MPTPDPAKTGTFRMFGGEARGSTFRVTSPPSTALAREGGQSTEPQLDQDQEKKYNEIVDLLLAGGYFRARITGLSRFDKVVGGLCWCITSSNEDVDIDIFFQEDATMGQRIKIGEEIIRALKRMNCPYRLDAHQIQGGMNTADFVNIYPIIQWLVKKVIETREETGDLMRRFSELQFNKNYELPDESTQGKAEREGTLFIDKISDRYKPTRKYKRPGRRVPYLNTRSEEENVASTLLEYGEYYRTNKQQTTDRAKMEMAKQLEKNLGAKRGATDEEDDETRRNQALQKELEAVYGLKIGRERLGELLPSNISDLQYEYEFNEEVQQGGKKQGLRMHQSQVSSLERSITQQRNALSTHRESHATTTEQFNQIQSEYQKAIKYNERIIQEIKKLEALETPENSHQLQMLRNLVALNENLIAQEQRFKQSCKKQMEELTSQIEEIKKQIENAGSSSEDQEVESQLQKTIEKLQRMKAIRAKKNRDISVLERTIDDVCSRSELNIYQRQFVELYDQMSSKLTETRQYYNTYNTLEDTRSYMSKELSILKSITDNYKTVMASKAGKEQFLSSLDTIVKGVQQSLDKTESKLTSEKEKKNQLNDKYTSLLDKERLYFKLTKEFLEECKRNEQLQQMEA